MIDVEIWRAQTSNYKCDNPDCPKNPKYFYRVLDVNYIKEGSIVAYIHFHKKDYEIYCEDCIDYVFDFLKSKLDKRLWLFQ